MTLALPVVDDPADIDWRADDVVLVTTKTQDSTGAFDALAAAAGPDVPVVCVQNGVANERIALRRFRRVYAICVMLPAEHLEPGVVAASSAPVSGLLDIGRYPAGVDDVAYAGRGRAGGRDVRVGPASGRHALEVPQAADEPRQRGRGVVRAGRRRDRAAARSRAAKARRCCASAGIDVASIEEDRERRGDRLTPRLARGGGSTWQSLRRGTGSLETDYLNGEIALLARLHGIESPVNVLLQTAANDAARRMLAPGLVAGIGAAQGCCELTETISPVMYEREVAREEDDDVGDLPGFGRAPNASRVSSSASSSSVVTLARNGCIASDGATALTRTLFAAASIAAQRVSAMTPAFAAA